MEITSTYLKQNGFQTSCFPSGPEVLVKLEQKKLNTDLILSDLNLPTLNGIDFLKKTQKLQTNIPVILITGEYSLDIALKAFEFGVSDYILKPIHFPQLLHSIKRCILKNEIRNSQIGLEIDFEESLVGVSQKFKNTIHMAQKVASHSSNVLITGESGSGKEVVANAIHQFAKKEGQFIAINCSAIPENLLESELFGHSKGSFTGALDKRIGLFEEANGGTLFLDEIGDLSLPLQAKLLRVIQEKKIKRVGENIFRNINTRIIAATHKDLLKEISIGNFREDLYYRLNVIPITLDPLRERTEDIIPLSQFFLKKLNQQSQNTNKMFSDDFLMKIQTHSWPGNVRELENTIERSFILSETDIISEPLFLSKMPDRVNFSDKEKFLHEIQAVKKKLSLEELNFQYIKHIFNQNNGAKEQTARDLGIDRKTLYRKLKEIERIKLH